ncbi:MAG: hypothetical protein KDK71_07855 [Chlamydiia bacterium]|nr:hypothetical protein [Chlamydiia bacterium]
MMTIQLPKQIVSEIARETRERFSCNNKDELKEYRGEKDSLNDQAVKKFMAELKKQKEGLYGELSAHFNGRSETEIKEGFADTSSDIYQYWTKLKANAPDAPAKRELCNKLNDVQQIGSAMNEIPLLYRPSTFAAMTGGLALYYLRSHPLIATIFFFFFVC